MNEHRSTMDLLREKFKHCVRKLQTSVDLAVDFGHKAAVIVRAHNHVKISSAGITLFLRQSAFRPALIRETQCRKSIGGGLFLWIYLASFVHQGP
ncbi:hypothetical protein AVEN_89148-1 [Araneus ventricosus]|uniref:Uncharacterized protein n=1 Tax=Araneus ventricosus TaxID=182803 RepID=A0A4Y2B472_ARAVE|nr:hypothetical protein AVEN_89148-1 [Araneus ventricosus]